MNIADAATNKTKTHKIINIGVLVYPGVALVDYTSGVDPFLKAARVDPNYKITVFSLKDNTVFPEDKLLVLKVKTIPSSKVPTFDLFIVPGSTMPIINNLITDKPFMTSFKEVALKAKVVYSVCTGAFLLADIGLLNDKKATTHYLAFDDLLKRYPKVIGVKNVRYVDNGAVVTAAGVTSGIDASLYLIEKYSGKATMHNVKGMLQHIKEEKEDWNAFK